MELKHVIKRFYLFLSHELLLLYVSQVIDVSGPAQPWAVWIQSVLFHTLAQQGHDLFIGGLRGCVEDRVGNNVTTCCSEAVLASPGFRHAPLYRLFRNADTGVNLLCERRSSFGEGRRMLFRILHY